MNGNILKSVQKSNEFIMATKDVIKALMNQRSKKLFKYLYQLPNYGVGRQFTRVIWKYDGNEATSGNNIERWGDPLSYWTITRVKPDGLLRGGKVWGILTWKGVPQTKEKHIKTCRKKHWKLIPKL